MIGLRATPTGIYQDRAKALGWAGNWSGGSPAATIVTAGNLSHGSVDTSGGGASAGSNATDDNMWAYRDLATPIASVGTNYFGFLLQQTGSADAKHNYVRLMTTSGFGGGSWVGAGSWNASSEWQLIRNNASGYGSVTTGDTEDNDVTYFVIKLDTSTEGSEVAYLYVDPTNAAALSGPADASYTYTVGWNADISRVQASLVGASGDVGTMAFDEIRIGTEASDMFATLEQVTVTDNGTNAPTIGVFDTGHTTPSNNRFSWDSGDTLGQSFTIPRAGNIKSIYIGYNAFDDGDDLTVTLSVNGTEVQAGILLNGNNFSGTEATDDNDGPFYWMELDLSSLNVVVNAGLNSFEMVATAGTEATGDYPVAGRLDNSADYIDGAGTGGAGGKDAIFAVTVNVPPGGSVFSFR
jgi:hypothetical protein